MYILYLDDAGSVGSKAERYFVLAGIALFERQIGHLQKTLDALAAAQPLPEAESLEFHASEIAAGRGRWRALHSDQRKQVLPAALQAATRLRGNWRLFGCAIDKAAVSPRDPAEYAFEQMCSRFDQFLARQRNDRFEQKGLIVFDKSVRENRLQQLTHGFRQAGHSWGKLRHIVDVPFFVDSRATRAIQFADLVAYALWRRFERDDDTLFSIIRNGFDSDGGVVHGLLHERYANSSCDCPYCVTRRVR